MVAAAKQRLVLEPLVPFLVQPSDVDLRDTVKSVMRLPKAWWAKLDQIEKDAPCERLYVIIQLVRWSQAQAEPAPLPEGPEFFKMSQSAVKFTKERWDLLDAEAKRRGLTRNRVLQAHLARGLREYESLRASEQKPKP